jgi:secreted PhoX family phosphatase
MSEHPSTPVPDLAADESGGEYFGEVIRRRSLLKGAGALGVGLVVSGGLNGTADAAPTRGSGRDHPGGWWYWGRRGIDFDPIEPSSDDEVIVADGYEHDVLLKWGDPLFPGAPAFDLNNQTRATQEVQFGFNCDFIGYFPLRNDFSWRNDKALLCVNHEYTTGGDMFPGYSSAEPTADQVDAELAAHGMTVAEIRERRGRWRFDQQSSLNRRITGFTPIEIAGPLRGHELLQTGEDPTGTEVLGMFNNCAGGKTPWGTVLTCEENFDQYFANYAEDGLSDRIPANSGESGRKWERYYDRFDLAKEPREYNRFGYVVEIDPYDPDFTPRKRTALGRFKHEGASAVLARDHRAVVYSGDDARFEYIYKFISEGTYNGRNREANFDLLDTGTLYVARFNDDGTGEWVALAGDAESIIDTRGSADAVGATKMDRPEDIEVNKKTGKVYVALTNNDRRAEVADEAGEVAANPRLHNAWGHIIEMTEDGNDPGSLSFAWEIFVLCGDPAQQGGITDLADLATDPSSTEEDDFPDAAYFAGFDPSQVSPIAAPDNLVSDSQGNLWVATDGQPGKEFFGQNDGVFAIPTTGDDRGWCRQFLSGIPGGEVCGPELSNDERTFFCGIQHPGDGGGLPNTISSWPDGNEPPKPSVIAVRHSRGRSIGS